MRRLLHRTVALFRSNKAERELAREIDAHLQLLEDQFMARGMTRDEARYAAKREFHGSSRRKSCSATRARSAGWPAGRWI
jgi:hypothetical protein